MKVFTVAEINAIYEAAKKEYETGREFIRAIGANSGDMLKKREVFTQARKDFSALCTCSTVMALIDEMREFGYIE